MRADRGRARARHPAGEFPRALLRGTGRAPRRRHGAGGRISHRGSRRLPAVETSAAARVYVRALEAEMALAAGDAERARAIFEDAGRGIADARLGYDLLELRRGDPGRARPDVSRARPRKGGRRRLSRSFSRAGRSASTTRRSIPRPSTASAGSEARERPKAGRTTAALDIPFAVGKRRLGARERRRRAERRLSVGVTWRTTETKLLAATPVFSLRQDQQGARLREASQPRLLHSRRRRLGERRSRHGDG